MKFAVSGAWPPCAFAGSAAVRLGKTEREQSKKHSSSLTPLRLTKRWDEPALRHPFSRADDAAK
eukprot:scaffold501_cov355-Pinguiococcus_pyrenoidosus.AAC.25